MRKSLVFLAAALLSSLVIAGCGNAKGSNIIATVGNKVITKSEFNREIAKLPPPYQKIANARPQEFLDELILEELLINEAKTRGLENNPEVRELFNEAKSKILVAKLVDDESRKITSVSDREMRTYYEENKSSFDMPERYRASHIMVDTQKEAQDILTSLKQGANFEELAKEKSTDPTKDRGGDIGYFAKGQLLPEFENTAMSLNVGEISGVVKSPIGYHIIKLTDKQDARIASFEEARPKIEALLIEQKRKEAFGELVKKLKDKSRIKINESALEQLKHQTQQPKESE
ncbi:MAG: peptidylprolyl isomerase [Candidatus Omnitrophota bacterium]